MTEETRIVLKEKRAVCMCSEGKNVQCVVTVNVKNAGPMWVKSM